MTINARVKKIAKSAVLQNVDIKSDSVIIQANAKLRNVRVEATKFFVGRETVIAGSIILSYDEVTIGKLVQIKEGSVLHAFKGVKVGDRSLIDRGVIIGGMQSEKSYFEVGGRCVILHHTYINTTGKVIIGNNVGIGGYCMIFTHGVWQNVFKGYPFQYGAVEIKDDAWLPWHVFVMPNVTIGTGSTIAGGSVVTKDIPDYCLAAGVPARIIQSEGYPKQLSLDEKDQLARKLLHDFQNYVKEYLGNKSIATKESDELTIVTSDIGNLVYCRSLSHNFLKSSKLKAFNLVSFIVPQTYRKSYGWIELETERRSSNLNKLSSEFANFIRRYGVRLVDEN